jgi:hypothetical protein
MVVVQQVDTNLYKESVLSGLNLEKYRQHVRPKCWQQPTILHGLITQIYTMNLDRFRNKIIQYIYLRMFTCYCCLHIYIFLLKKFLCALQNSFRHTTPCSILLVEKLIVVQLVKKFLTFYTNSRFFKDSQEPAIYPYPNQVNLVYILSFCWLKIHFNIIIL